MQQVYILEPNEFIKKNVNDQEGEKKKNGRVVLEPCAYEDLPPISKNEESLEEEQVVLVPMDVHIIVVDEVVSSIEEGKIDELSFPFSP